MLDTLFKKRNTEYDIYYYYSTSTKKYGKYLENLSKYIPDEYLRGYDKSIINESCTSKDNILVGLVIYIFINII